VVPLPYHPREVARSRLHLASLSSCCPAPGGGSKWQGGPQNGRLQSSGRSRRGGAMPFTGRCFLCGEVGHRMTDCNNDSGGRSRRGRVAGMLEKEEDIM